MRALGPLDANSRHRWWPIPPGVQLVEDGRSVELITKVVKRGYCGYLRRELKDLPGNEHVLLGIRHCADVPHESRWVDGSSLVLSSQEMGARLAERPVF